MIENATVNLAPFLNILIYISLFLLINLLYRWLLRVTYGKRIAKVCKLEVLRVLSEHKKTHKFKNSKALIENLHSINIDLKKRFSLLRGPINFCDEDVFGYEYYSDIQSYFKIRNIQILKNFLFYKMRITKFDKDRISYKNCLVENRENKIDNLLD